MASEVPMPGDGRDDPVGGIRNAARALKQTTRAAGSTAALMKGAALGAWGAAVSAAWSMRHTLARILVCMCLLVTVFVVILTAIPAVVTQTVRDSFQEDPEAGMNMQTAFGVLTADVSRVIDAGYRSAQDRVEDLIRTEGCDREESLAQLRDLAGEAAGYDVSLILAAYSASVLQQHAQKEEMLSKLAAQEDTMFPVTWELKTRENIIPVEYTVYAPVTVTVVTSQKLIAYINGKPYYDCTTQERTMYLPDETATSDRPITLERYRPVSVRTPVYEHGRISGTVFKTFYVPDGSQTLTPETEVKKLACCTIHPFDPAVVYRAFDLDPEALCPPFSVSYETVIRTMALALRKTAGAGMAPGSQPPLSQPELLAFLNRQGLTGERREVLSTALSLVGKVPYFWGGKSSAGWNEAWNTPKLVTAAGSVTTGTIQPYGLDCSGFTDWVFRTSLGVSLETGTGNQWDNAEPVPAAELQPGDLGFLQENGSGWTHVLICAGTNPEGERLWVHCSFGSGVVLNAPEYAGRLILRRPHALIR